jgi:hypothetical protein
LSDLDGKVKKMKLLTLLLALIFSQSVFAFIPPLASLVKDAFEGRKATPVEIVIRHRVEPKGLEALEIEEHILADRSHTYISWKTPQISQPVWASLEKKNYVFSTGGRVSSHSSLFLKYLVDSSADDYANALFAEQFIHRDQLLQFKPGFELTGDPQSWAIKDNYIQHEGVYLKRLKSGGAGYAITGYREGATSRVVVFDKDSQGIRRLEWKDGEETTAWNFNQITKFGQGYYPKRMSLERNGVDVVGSELVMIKAVKEKQVGEFRNALQRAGNAPIPQNLEEALKILLSER